MISKTPFSVNALKNVEIFYNVQYEPIALMEGVEDINAYVTETALLLVEKWSATVGESVFRKEDDQDLDLDPDPDQGIIPLLISYP